MPYAQKKKKPEAKIEPMTLNLHALQPTSLTTELPNIMKTQVVN